MPHDVRKSLTVLAKGIARVKETYGARSHAIVRLQSARSQWKWEALKRLLEPFAPV